MTRVFPIEEWAPAQELQTPSNSSLSPNDTDDSTKSLPLPPFRKRLQSLPLAGSVGRDSEVAERVQNMGFGDTTQEDEKKPGGLRGLLRRASVSIKNRQRRHSHAVEERPHTAWHKLKTATSFHRHSRFLPSTFDEEDAYESHEMHLTPIPGNGNAPPIIPGCGGAAARANAAAQNEYLEHNRQLLFPEDQLGDRESGIGIAITAVDQMEGYVDHSICSEISRVDFVAALPVELAIQVLAHLDQKTLRNALAVSKKWHEILQSQHIWREVFLREQTKGYATSKPTALGAGLGLPSFKHELDWKDLYRIREQLNKNWGSGVSESVYLNGHLDSIYCVQFDEYESSIILTFPC
jgi:F-box and WD-40 domain protein 1/11